MSLDDVRQVGGAFGAALAASVDALEKDAEIRGGGLRHGEVEWQVSYLFDGLRRVLLFDLVEAPGTLITVSSQAMATDDAGRWAAAVGASASVPRQFLLSELPAFVRQLFDQTRFVANTFDETNMRPMVLGGAEVSTSTEVGSPPTRVMRRRRESGTDV